MKTDLIMCALVAALCVATPARAQAATEQNDQVHPWVAPSALSALTARDKENLDVIIRSWDATSRVDLKAISDIWTDDAVKEFPYAPPQVAHLIPRRIEGKPALMAYYRRILKMQGQASALKIDSVRPLREPDTLLIEYHEDTEVKGSSNLVASFIAIVQLRDGKIAHWREFFDPTPILASFATK